MTTPRSVILTITSIFYSPPIYQLYQNQHTYLKEFLGQRLNILTTILQQDCLADSGICQDCKSDKSFWRCVDCLGRHASCRDCLRKSHFVLPFHRIQFWVGTHYESDWLHNLGVAVNLGHGGSCCPDQSNTLIQAAYKPPERPIRALKDYNDPYASPSKFCDIPQHANLVTVLHTNGVHQVWIRPCKCTKDKDTVHFLQQALFPATFKATRSAFTFSLLDDFRKANLICKTMAYSYFHKLRLLNSEFFPESCPVCIK